MPVKLSGADTLDKWSACLKDKTLGPKILAEAKKQHSMENVEFLNAMKVGDRKQTAYDKYIKAGAPKQVNLPQALVAKFDAVAKTPKPDWSKAPWADAIKNILNFTRENLRNAEAP